METLFPRDGETISSETTPEAPAGGSDMFDRFRHDESGASLVEYGLLVGLIAVIAITSVSALGQMKDVFAKINNTMAGYNL